MIHHVAARSASQRIQSSTVSSLRLAVRGLGRLCMAGGGTRYVWSCALSFAAVFLAGCAASSTQYYSLQPDASKVTSSRSSFEDALNVQDVNVPASVDRPQIIVSGQGGGVVSVLNNSLWVAPLADEVRLALANRLSGKLGVPDLNSSGAPQGLPLWTVRFSVDRFEAVYGQRVLIESHWRLGRTPEPQGPGLPVVCRARVELPVATGVEAVVVGWQKALVLLADQIALQIEGARVSKPVISGSEVTGSAVTLQGCAQPPATR